MSEAPEPWASSPLWLWTDARPGLSLTIHRGGGRIWGSAERETIRASASILLLWALALEIDERAATRTGAKVCCACGGRGEVIVALDHGPFVDPAFIFRCRARNWLHRIVESGTTSAAARYGSPEGIADHTRIVVDPCECWGPTRPATVSLSDVVRDLASLPRPRFEWPHEWLVAFDKREAETDDWVARWWVALREWSCAGKLPAAEALAADLAALLPELEAREQAKRSRMTCPTCDDAEAGRCCDCSRPLARGELELTPDPYASDINGDESLHLQCDSCAHESAQDI